MHMQVARDITPVLFNLTLNLLSLTHMNSQIVQDVNDEEILLNFEERRSKK